MVILTSAKSKDKIQQVLNQSGGVAILDFIEKKNKKCEQLEPFVQQLNAEHNVPLIRIDMDSVPHLSQAYLVENASTFVVVKQNWNNIIHIKECNDKKDIRKIFDTAMNNMERQIMQKIKVILIAKQFIKNSRSSFKNTLF